MNSICNIFIWWDGKHCPCCGMVLRTRPRNTKNRQKLQMILTLRGLKCTKLFDKVSFSYYFGF